MISDQGLKNLPPDCMTDWEPEVSHELLYWIVFFSLCPLVEKGAYKNLFFFSFSFEDCKIHQISARPVCTLAAPLD